MSETKPCTDPVYIEGRKRFIQLEMIKWEEQVKTPCKALVNNYWLHDFCRLTDRACDYGDCMALQIIKLAKGFL